ncbi:hypothetical protein BH20ACT6_BH20ACT6_25300 [soil metagenome]
MGDSQSGDPPICAAATVFTNFYTTTTAASADRLAFVREVTGWSVSRGRMARAGLMVVDRETGANLAQLPMSFGLALATAPAGWLDSDTLLLRVGDELLSWEFETGELQRITTLDGPATLSAASALIERFGR